MPAPLPPLGTAPSDLAAQLRAGVQPPDAAFDQHLPPDLRVLSDRHWTPLHVVARAVRWLEAERVRSLVDIGSGAGKFCVAAALCGNLRCTGLERSAPLVAAARDLAARFGVSDRVAFTEGAFPVGQVPHADAYYLFNPFEEVGKRPDEHAVHAARQFLSRLPPGSLVLTYHGFGARMPRGYREVQRDSVLGLLRMWRRAS